jgi:membrane associated rhomboid family serine protease
VIADANHAVAERMNLPMCDIVVLFAAAISWVSAEPAHPSVVLLVVLVIATPTVVLLAVFAKQDFVAFDFVKAALATLAFVIWSLSVPRSGWQQWHVVSEHPGWVAAASSLGGLMFGLLASGIERKYGSGEYK